MVQDSVTVFNWYKNGGKLSESGENITFSSLRLSDAAEYTCNATAGNMIHESSGDSYTITVQSKIRLIANIFVASSSYRNIYHKTASSYPFKHKATFIIM